MFYHGTDTETRDSLRPIQGKGDQNNSAQLDSAATGTES